MRRTRVMSVVTAAAVTVLAAVTMATAAPADGVRDATKPAEAGVSRLADGTYLACVRTLGRTDDVVAVDLGRNVVLVHAGLLAKTGLLTARVQPWRIVIVRGAIAEVTTAEATCDAGAGQPAGAS